MRNVGHQKLKQLNMEMDSESSATGLGFQTKKIKRKIVATVPIRKQQANAKLEIPTCN